MDAATVAADVVVLAKSSVNIWEKYFHIPKPTGIIYSPLDSCLLVTTEEHNVIRVTPFQTSQIFAGRKTQGYRDGKGSFAMFNNPLGIALDGQGVLYVADNWNYVIRKIDRTGLVSTVVGKAGTKKLVNGPVAGASILEPRAMVFRNGSLIIIETSGTENPPLDVIRILSPDQSQISVLAGKSGRGFQDGPGLTAKFDTPLGITVDGKGILYVADTGNHLIRTISPDSNYVSTLACLK